MTVEFTGELYRINRQKAKPPPATTTHHNRVYTTTRIESDKIQLAKSNTNATT